MTPESDNLGCGLDPREDQNPAIDGYQALLVARSQNCNAASFVQGSNAAESADIIEGAATYIANLQAGTASVEVTASGPGYTSRTVSVDLTSDHHLKHHPIETGRAHAQPCGPNVFGAAQGEDEAGSTTWRLNGQATGLRGATVEVVFSPALETPDDAATRPSCK